MNIFILHKDPKKCAQMHCDKHTTKMILEHAQMLSTTYRLTHGKLQKVAIRSDKGISIKDWYLIDSDIVESKPAVIHGDFYPVLKDYEVYAPTHINHPCTKWVRKSLSNYNWLVQMTKHLNDEYKYRFDHKENHKSWDMISDYLLDIDLSDFGLTKPALAMDEEYKITSKVVQSYRNYYIEAKAHLLTYTKRKKPVWLGEI